jgi:hypothetical protein
MRQRVILARMPYNILVKVAGDFLGTLVPEKNLLVAARYTPVWRLSNTVRNISGSSISDMPRLSEESAAGEENGVPKRKWDA